MNENAGDAVASHPVLGFQRAGTVEQVKAWKMSSRPLSRPQDYKTGAEPRPSSLMMSSYD